MTPPTHVLLVNDIPDHIRPYEAILSQHGFQVQLARSGEEALRIAHTAFPECVVIDLRLPDMSAWELCRELRENRKHQPRIIVLTPEVSKTCAADSARVGCHAWLAHPTVAEDLAQTVRQVLNLSTDAPPSAEEALVGLTECPGCDSEQIRSTLRVGHVQYYCCKACGFCWRVERLAPHVPAG
jgi:CheY-like chemotaxis protein